MVSVRESLNEWLPSGVKVGFGTVYLYTEQGLSAVEKVSERDFWDWWHDVGIVSLVASMVLFVAFIAVSAVLVLITDPPASSAAEPGNLLAIPGLNDYIPVSQLWTFVVALFVAIVVHEGGHAVAALREGIGVEEWGLIFFLGVIPIGAYVYPDEESLELAPLRPFSRVMSAGIMNNYVVAVISMVYFFVPSTPGFVTVLSDHVGLVSGEAAFLSYGVVTVFVYWVWFINFNLGLVNTLPIPLLDGGRVVGKFSDERIRGRVAAPVVGTVNWSTLVKAGVGVVSLGSFLLMAFGAML